MFWKNLSVGKVDVNHRLGILNWEEMYLQIQIFSVYVGTDWMCGGGLSVDVWL